MDDHIASEPTPFDRLMCGLIAVPKDELEAEIAKEEREKTKKEAKPDGRAKRKK